MSRSNLMAKINTDILFDPNATYAQIEAELSSHIIEFLPTKRVKLNKYKHKKTPWITTGIMKSMQKRDTLYRKWKSCKPTSPNYYISKLYFQTC